MDKIKLGNRTRISDPCYSKETWCAGTVGTKSGEWVVTVEQKDFHHWGRRIVSLEAVHEDYYPLSYRWDAVPFEVGVDSGQCGIFNDVFYPESSESEDYDEFYQACCDTTDDYWGVIREGVVCRSGFGDGGYRAYWSKDPSDPKQQAIAIKVVFIEDEKAEDQEDD